MALIYFAVKRDGKSAVLVGALVPTHWLLDFVAHRPDMPIYPGGPKYGLGMWNSIPLSISVEYLLFAAGTRSFTSLLDSRKRRQREMGVLVVHFISWGCLSSFAVRPSTSHRASPGVERDCHVAYGAVGCMG